SPLTASFTLPRARGPGRGRPELRGRSPTRSVAPNSRGPPACFHFGAWVPNNLARQKCGLMVSAANLALNLVIGINWFRRPFNRIFHPPARARARPWSARATGSLANAIGRTKQQRASGVLSLWRVGAEQSGAAKMWINGFGGESGAEPSDWDLLVSAALY